MEEGVDKVKAGFKAVVCRQLAPEALHLQHTRYGSLLSMPQQQQLSPPPQSHRRVLDAWLFQQQETILTFDTAAALLRKRQMQLQQWQAGGSTEYQSIGNLPPKLL